MGLDLGQGDTVYSAISKRELRNLYRIGYTFGRKIGEGSTAAVYLAQHIDGPRCITLACKVYKEGCVSPEFRRRFMPRELSIAYTLDHENVVRLHSIVRGRGYFYLFTEWADGGDLFDWLAERGRPSRDKARQWFQQIARGLSYLHSREIAHRDLKCENILLAQGGKVLKIADFGFTRYCIGVRGERIRSMTYCGSTAYAAPEVIRGVPYEPKKADVWSAGVVLFALLNGSLPFSESNTSRLYREQVSGAWRRGVVSDAPRQATALLAQVLEPEAAKRPSIDRVAKAPWLKQGPGSLVNVVKKRPKTA